MAVLILVFFLGAAAEVQAEEPPPSSELLYNANGANDTFAAIAQFRGASNCTGSLIDPSGTAPDEARAWLLTAGHCISLAPYAVIRNQPFTEEVQFNLFVDTPDRRVVVRSSAVGWSTMKSTDLALVELDATLGELRARGIHPLHLASRASEPSRAVFWTGVSGSPIPAELRFLRLGRCTLGSQVQVIERFWIWNGELSNNCPDLYAGASGSPLFDAESGEVIGVIGTSTLLNFEHGPDYDCQLNRPCVTRTGGPVMQRDTSYASPVQGIAQCFDQANVLDVQRPGCPLDPGLQLTIQSGATEVRLQVNGRLATWDAELTGSHRYYAYKRFPMGEGDCGSLAGYSAPILLAGAPVIRDLIGTRDGYYFLCVIAGNTPSFDSSWQQPPHASVRFKRLDSQPPVVAVDYQIEELGNVYRLVNKTGGEGPSGLGIALFKRGSPSITDCADREDYRIQTSIPQTVRTSDFPTRICWMISDRAGNFADPVVFDFGLPVILPNGARNAASLDRGTIAAGSVFRVDTFNLTDRAEFSSVPVETLAGVRMWVVDSVGRKQRVLMTTAGPLFLEAVMSEATATGSATIIVQPPQGFCISQPVEIRPSAPGLYFDVRSGAPLGYVSDSKGNLFPLSTRLPLSSTPDGLNFVLYGTGVRAVSRSARLDICTHALKAINLRPHPAIAGVDEIWFHLPRDFPLRMYQPVSIDTPSRASNHLWIYLE